MLSYTSCHDTRLSYSTLGDNLDLPLKLGDIDASLTKTLISLFLEHPALHLIEKNNKQSPIGLHSLHIQLNIKTHTQKKTINKIKQEKKHPLKPGARSYDQSSCSTVI